MNSKRTTIGRLVSIISLAVLVMGVTTAARAGYDTNFVYSENFDSYADGTLLSALGWTTDGSPSVIRTSGLGNWPADFPAVGSYVEGTTSAAGGQYYDIPSLGLINQGRWTLSADVRFLAPAGGGMGIGFHNSLSGSLPPPPLPANPHQVQGEGANATVTYSSYTWGLGAGVTLTKGTAPTTFVYVGGANAAEAFHMEMVMDFDYNTHSATITKLDDPSQVWTTGVLPFQTTTQDQINKHFAFDRIFFYQPGPGNGSIQIDKILLYSIPEPASMGMALAGLVGLIGMRRLGSRRTV